MVNDNHLLKITKIFSGLLVTLFLFVVSSEGSFAQSTDSHDATECPTGFVRDNLLNPRCCQGTDSGDTRVVRNPSDTEYVCSIQDSAGVADPWLLTYPVLTGAFPTPMYCGANMYQLGRTCYEMESEVPVSGIFLGCINTVEVTVWDGDNSSERDLGFCSGYDNAVFADSLDVCVCEGESEPVPVEDDDMTCVNVCGEGNVFYSPLGGGGAWESNRSVECTTAGGQPGVVTALGCIPTGQTGITNWVMRFGFFISGALVVFRIIQGSIMIMTAIGNPDKIQEGKAVITSAIVGLMVILGAVMLLQFMGVDFLGLEIEGLG